MKKTFLFATALAALSMFCSCKDEIEMRYPPKYELPELPVVEGIHDSLKTLHSLLTASVAAVRSAYCQVATCTTVRLPADCLQIESVIYHPFYQL